MPIAEFDVRTQGPSQPAGRLSGGNQQKVVLARELSRGNFDKAARDVDDGLELATETTYFRGHLFEVRGLVEERRAKALEKEEKTSEAQAAKKRALDAFEESMKIQAEVIKKAVPTEAGP